LSLLFGAARLVLLPALFPLLPPLLLLSLLFIVPRFRLATLLILAPTWLLVLILRLLLIIISLATPAAPVILSAHEDGRAQAERNHQ
jgi:hypothetical protein